MADKEVSKNYFNIPSTLKNDEVLVYYHLCKSTNFTVEEFRGKSRFECFASKRTRKTRIYQAYKQGETT